MREERILRKTGDYSSLTTDIFQLVDAVPISCIPPVGPGCFVVFGPLISDLRGITLARCLKKGVEFLVA